MQYLIRQTYRVKSGDTILLHAAAGGVGLILSQWAKHLGATVIGTVGNDDKAKLAKAPRLRPHHRLFDARISSNASTRSPAARRCRWSMIPSARTRSSNRWTVWRRSASPRCSARLPARSIRSTSACWRRRDRLFVTRPTLNTYAARRENLVAMAKELFDVVKSGAVKIEVHQTYPLKDAAKAHADLAARKTTGTTVDCSRSAVRRSEMTACESVASCGRFRHGDPGAMTAPRSRRMISAVRDQPQT